MIEEWKDIKNFEGIYQVSSLGRIKSVPREGTKGGIIKQFLDGRYMKVHLYKNGKDKFLYVHRLVAIAFIENKDNKPQINHINGKKTDNRLVNLEWSTSKENLEHAVNTGLRHLKKVAQIKDGKIIKIFNNCRRASIETGIAYPNIWYVLNGKNKTTGGFVWKYINND